MISVPCRYIGSDTTHIRMKEIVDFHQLPHDEKEDLVENERVVVRGQLAEEMPESGTAVTVLEGPLSEVLIELLKQGRYTAGELSEETDIDPQYIRVRLHESFWRDKRRVLASEQAVIRVVDRDEGANVYTLESIPFAARILDPLLLVSLGEIKNRLNRFPVIERSLYADEEHQIDREYAEFVAPLWDIPVEELIGELIKYSRGYVATDLFPMPLVDSDDPYSRVQDRLRCVPDYYDSRVPTRMEARSRLAASSVIEADPTDVHPVEYQAFALDLFDLTIYIEHGADELEGVVDSYRSDLVTILDPEDSLDIISDTDSIDLKQTLMGELTTTPKTATGYYEELPEGMQHECTLADVETALENLVGQGIAKRVDADGEPLTGVDVRHRDIDAHYVST